MWRGRWRVKVRRLGVVIATMVICTGCVTAMVGEGLMRDRRSAMTDMALVLRLTVDP